MAPRVGQREALALRHSDSGWDLRKRRVGELGASSLSLLGYRYARQPVAGETQTPPSKD
jgi:hypothetical protein